MLGNQEFAGLCLMLKALREEQAARTDTFSPLSPEGRMRLRECVKVLDNPGTLSEDQEKAFNWLMNLSRAIGPDEITEARIKALAPLERLSWENRTKRGKVRKVRALGARVLNIIGAGHSGPIPWIKKGGSQYQALGLLVGRRLLRETYTNGILGWEEGEDLRSWIEAGGFV